MSAQLEVSRELELTKVDVILLSEPVLISKEGTTLERANKEVERLSTEGKIYHVASEGEVLALAKISRTAFSQFGSKVTITSTVSERGGPQGVGFDSMGPYFCSDLSADRIGTIILIPGPSKAKPKPRTEA